MYKSSSSPVFADRAANLARTFAASDARIKEARQASLSGRVRAFNLLVSPTQVNNSMGTAAGVAVASGQDQSIASRASGVLSIEPSGFQGYTQAPECLPMRDNIETACSVARPRHAATSLALLADARPGMPQMGPRIFAGPNGPLHFRGERATFSRASSQGHGLTGIAPSWNDAGVIADSQYQSGRDMGVASWLMAHRFLSLAIAGAGVYALWRGASR